MSNTIKKFISLLISENNDNDKYLSLFFNSDSFYEDGMNYEQYLNYEKNNFKQLCPIFDLNEFFDIEIYHTQKNKETETHYVFIKNQYNKIVCKLQYTLKNDLFFGNQFKSQIVPKFIIQNNQITAFAIAIESPFLITDVISSDGERTVFNKANNFEEDNFLSAQFISDNTIQNKTYSFYLKYLINEKEIIEKRKVYFDFVDFNNFPILIQNKTLSTIDSLHPVNIALFGIENINYSYPRNLTISLSQYNKIIVTDSLDNDWIIDF